MKIIFDSEIQKELFMERIVGADGICPGILGLNEISCKLGEGRHCQKCWEISGLEMEIADDDPGDPDWDYEKE